jgi:pantoate--beta-alanine ligase
MVSKNNLEVNVIGCAIYRESNGLWAPEMSDWQISKERRLFNFKTLNLAKEKFKSNSATAVTQWVEESFKTNTSFKLEYFQIADETTLKPCLRKIPKNTVLL